MKRGFYTIMSAQFFSSLADNALFVTAVELLKSEGTAEWQRAALVPMFALFYVVLAPFVGAFADSRPKGDVMLMSNTIKVVGCLVMLFGLHPLLIEYFVCCKHWYMDQSKKWKQTRLIYQNTSHHNVG